MVKNYCRVFIGIESLLAVATGDYSLDNALDNFRYVFILIRDAGYTMDGTGGYWNGGPGNHHFRKARSILLGRLLPLRAQPSSFGGPV
jgi:hypothetical protein